jgi:hypothetical protein
MDWKATCSTIVCLAVSALYAVPAPAQDSPNLRDGTTGYTMACAIGTAVGTPAVHHCAELGAAQRCEHEADLASHPSQEAAGLTIVNRSDEPIKLYWLTFSGRRRLYHSLAPGERVVQQTFIGHNWMITNNRGECIGIFNAAPISIAFF